MSYLGTLSVDGAPAATTTVTCADARQSLATLLGLATLVRNGQDPSGVLLSVATGGNAAKISWGASASGGHELAAAASARFTGAPAVKDLWLQNNAAGSNSTVVVTLYY